MFLIFLSTILWVGSCAWKFGGEYMCDFGVESKKGVRLTNVCKCFFFVCNGNFRRTRKT
jgi:hypothetical protein